MKNWKVDPWFLLDFKWKIRSFFRIIKRCLYSVFKLTKLEMDRNEMKNSSILSVHRGKSFVKNDKIKYNKNFHFNLNLLSFSLKRQPSRRFRAFCHLSLKFSPSHLVKLSYSLIFEMDKTSCYAASIALEKEKRAKARKRDTRVVKRKSTGEC